MARILGVDHICFVVKDLERTISFVEKVLGGKHLSSQSRGEEASSALYDIGGIVFNFVTAPMDGKGFFAEFLRNKGEGLHHIGLSVDDLDSFKEVMSANGIKIPQWELEGNQAIRDEVLIGTKHAPTVLQILCWAGGPPASTKEWINLEKKYMAKSD